MTLSYHRTLLANYQTTQTPMVFQLTDGSTVAGTIESMAFDAEDPQNDTIVVWVDDDKEITLIYGQIFRTYMHAFTNLSPREPAVQLAKQ